MDINTSSMFLGDDRRMLEDSFRRLTRYEPLRIIYRQVLLLAFEQATMWTDELCIALRVLDQLTEKLRELLWRYFLSESRCHFSTMASLRRRMAVLQGLRALFCHYIEEKLVSWHTHDDSFSNGFDNSIDFLESDNGGLEDSDFDDIMDWSYSSAETEDERSDVNIENGDNIRDGPEVETERSLCRMYGFSTPIELCLRSD